MTLKTKKEVVNMKRITTILTNLLKGGKILKGLKIVKEILGFVKTICIIVGSSFIVNTLEFINSFRFLNSSIITMLTSCITWTMYMYIAIQTIKTLLRFLPMVKEIIKNPLIENIKNNIKENLKSWKSLIKAKTENKED